MKKLIFYTKDIPDFYSSCDFFNFFQAGFGGQPGLIDRTNTINSLSGKCLTTLYPFSYKYTNTNLSDVINYRANQIISTGKQVDVFWSGGIDSTLALISLLKNSTSQWKTYNLRIILNYKSIQENPHIYDYVKKYNIINIPKDYILHYYNTIANDSIIVTGEMGDQIMGSHFCFTYPDIALSPYKEVLLDYLQCNDKFKDAVEKTYDVSNVIQVCELLEKVCPFPIKTLYDLLTWINIDLTWDFNCNRYLHSNIPFNNLYNFFNTQDFQDWGISNHYVKEHQLKAKKYKVEYRKYIDDYFKDGYAYLMQKKTSPSTSSSIVNDTKNIIAIDDSFTLYYNNKIDKLRIRKINEENKQYSR